jgi:hypothetical protein
MLDGDGLGRGEGGRLPLGDACAAAAAVAVASFASRLPEKDSMKSFMESTGLDHPVLKPAMLCCLAPRECKDRAAGKGLQRGLRRWALQEPQEIGTPCGIVSLINVFLSARVGHAGARRRV